MRLAVRGPTAGHEHARGAPSQHRPLSSAGQTADDAEALRLIDLVLMLRFGDSPG